MMAKHCMSECITGIVRSAGRIVGIKLAASLIREPLERTRTFYREVKDIRSSDGSIEIFIDDKVPDKRAGEIFMALLRGIDTEYSKVIGKVSRTLIRKSLEDCARKHGNECPVVKKLPEGF